MPRIVILPPEVADQIAAGEVVERPASVVKELVENALDAGAARIEIALEDGGRESIRVADDGEGLEAEDARLAIERHATSKIRRSADLVGVPTYGFRGEALAAIASVSRFEIETAARNGNGVGTHLTVRGGRVERVEEIARTPGTTVTVRKLFANVPARRKFLRSARSETRAAVEALTVLALARLDVAFTLTSGGRTLVEAPRASQVAERLAALFGRRFAETLVPVEANDGYVSVRGFAQRPADARPSGRKTFLFVNGRPFRDPFLVRAAEAGYRATIAGGLRPSLVLAIAVPGDRVDVNVHPAKLEVRFLDKFLVERAVEGAVRAALAPLGAAAQIGQAAGGDAPASDFRWREADRRGLTEDATADVVAGTLFDLVTNAPVPDAETGLAGTILQAFDTYLLFETPEGLTIVDQHSAHERVLYERAMAQLVGDGAGGQRLLLPLTIDLGPAELEAVEEHGALLAQVGYEVEPFGGRSIVVHAVPNPHPRFDARRCLEEMVADLARGRFGGWHNRLERFAATFGCRAAIKAGHHLEPEERRRLLAALFQCELPPHDVHGRPTIVQLPRHELERRFGRA